MEQKEYKLKKQVVEEKYSKRRDRIDRIIYWGTVLGLSTFLISGLGGIFYPNFNPHKNNQVVVKYQAAEETLINLRNAIKNPPRLLNLPYQPEDISPEIKDLFYNPEGLLKRDSLDGLISKVETDLEKMESTPEVVNYERWVGNGGKPFVFGLVGGYLTAFLFCLVSFPLKGFNNRKKRTELEALTKLYAKSKEKEPDVKV